MLSTRSSEKSLLIKQDDKFFSRLLSRDLSMSRTNKNGSSFRGLPSSVPFTWESQPGTPKHQFYSSSASQLLLPPPLTPPPSYYSAHSHNHNKIKIRRHTSSSKSTMIFNKLNFLKWRVNNAVVSAQPSSPSISSYSYSSSPSSFACSSTTTRTRIRFGSWGGSSSSNSSKADHEEDSGVSPSSTLCFMTRRKISRNAVWDLQKKELMSVHGSN